ncbi:MAG: patatin-like phospholipase family protein, partial [Alistipes sp.]|nr:patatin-like phospholipase family protein [Alistipes sp.]
MERKKVEITSRSGLILEGGGMRGVFTCGVLDNLMDRGIRFPYTIGVSAGACNGLSY